MINQKTSGKTMGKTISIVLGIIIIVFQGSLPAQEIQQFSLEKAREYALENNREVRRSLLEIYAASKQRWEVTASGFPQVEISATYNKLVDIPTQLIPGEIFGGDPGSTIPVQFGRPHNANYGISVSQLLFSGSYFVGVQASKIFMQLSETGYEKTKLDIKATVTNTYYLVLIAEENRDILSESLKNVRQTHYEISEMYEEGFSERTDVTQLQISVNELENAVRQLDEQIEIAYNLLKLQMGLPLDQEIVLTDQLPDFLNAVQVEERLKVGFNLYDNVTFRAISTQEELARLSVAKEKTTFLPTLAAFGSLQRDAQRDEFNFFDTDEDWYPTTVVGIQMNWPLFSGGAKMFKLQKARIELKQARLQKMEVEEGLRLQYDRVKSKIRSAQDQFGNAKSNRELSLEVYNITKEKFSEGLVSSLELTQAHNQYLASERAYLEAVNALLNADTDLKKILEIL